VLVETLNPARSIVIITSLTITTSAGDEEKLLSVRLLRGYIGLLGPHIRTVLHSDVHLRRLSAALTHVLQFDCSLIQIIDEHTAGQWVTLTFDSAFHYAFRWSKVRSEYRFKSKSKV